jgi:hypothetical protein
MPETGVTQWHKIDCGVLDSHCLTMKRPLAQVPNTTIAYVERPAVAALSWAVKCLWSLEGHLIGEAAAIPKPYVELVLSLGDGHLWHAGSATTVFEGGWVTR